MKLLALVLALLALPAGAALADGDPASDYLIGGPVFVTFAADLSSAPAKTLAALLGDSKRKGFPLKVAVIYRPADLGSVPSLFGKPQQYARFLGQEDYYFFKDELLVVMPQGYGLYRHGGVPPADRAALGALPPPGRGSPDALVDAASHAVRTLAARRGLELSSASSSSRWRDRAVIAAGVLALLALGIGVRAVVRGR